MRRIPKAGGIARRGARPAAPGARAAGTAILFLLEQERSSHWHRVDADELWLWHAGAPLELRIAGAIVTLDADYPQALVPADAWQAAHARLGWTLVSCVVVPGFDFAGFTLAPEGWEPD